MNYEYGKSYTFMALSLLYPTLDFNNKLHQDHIYPRNLFKKPELRKMGIKEDRFEYYLNNHDKPANLQLLPGIPNEEKASKDFKKWLSDRFENEFERRDFMTKHYIPQNLDLDFNNFEEFVARRKDIIKKQLKEILPFATDIVEDDTR